MKMIRSKIKTFVASEIFVNSEMKKLTIPHLNKTTFTRYCFVSLQSEIKLFYWSKMALVPKSINRIPNKFVSSRNDRNVTCEHGLNLPDVKTYHKIFNA